jgi:hypothetical protein
VKISNDYSLASVRIWEKQGDSGCSGQNPVEYQGARAPTSICTVGQTQLMPYTTDYVFFHKD